MEQEKYSEDKFLRALRIVAPGTSLRDGLENILRAKTGALLVIGDSEEVLKIAEGGFRLDCDFSPAYLYELAKMDGAIILSRDSKKILFANTQLVPESSIPSVETGIRHRTAERVARQTGELVISISQRRNVITIYKGTLKYSLRETGVILTKANQAIQTLEKYKSVLDQTLTNLSALEFDDMVTIFDVVKVIQRTEMVMRIVKEIEKYISELGAEGRLISMQLEELVAHVEDEGLLVIKDYFVSEGTKTPEGIEAEIRQWSQEELLDLVEISRLLGYGASLSSLEHSVSPCGYRLLHKLPRLPFQIIDNLVNSLGKLQSILEADIDKLDDVEGIGAVRAKAIKEGLKRLREQFILENHY